MVDETMPKENISFLESIFGAPIFNNYGHRECQNIATQCVKRGGLHTKPQANIVEIVDDAGNLLPAGEIGHIVVTGLDSFAMPFIRYKTGDLGRFLHNGCDCGLGAPVIEFYGRDLWYFVLPGGRKIPFKFIKDAIRPKLWMKIKQFQFVQEAVDYVKLFIVPGGQWSEGDYADLKLESNIFLKDFIQAGVKFQVFFVDKIDSQDIRKPREFISKIE